MESKLGLVIEGEEGGGSDEDALEDMGGDWVVFEVDEAGGLEAVEDFLGGRLAFKETSVEKF